MFTFVFLPPGLLWNLSSADNLKPDLLKNALSALTECVRLPSTNETATTERDPEVFFHATGCLRFATNQTNKQNTTT